MRIHLMCVLLYKPVAYQTTEQVLYKFYSLWQNITFKEVKQFVNYYLKINIQSNLKV